MRVANGGNVGIGTSSPLARIHVPFSASGLANGTLRLGSNETTYPEAIYSISWGGSGQMGMGPYPSTRGAFGRQGLGVHVINTEEIAFKSTNWTNLFAIEGGSGNAYIRGNVGIGTTAPSCALHVNGYISTPNNIYVSAWCKYGDGDFRVAVDAVVIWNQVYLNIGSCLNTGTGVFTASVKGYYYISWNGLLDNTASAGALKLEKNEVMVNGMQPWKDIATTNVWINVASSTIQQLNVGDRIRVKTVGCRMFCGNNNGHNSFVVYLLSAIA